MNYCTCNEKGITVYALDVHVLDEPVASRWLTWHLTFHPVNDTTKVFAKDKSTSGLCTVGEGYNLLLELQVLRYRIRWYSQNTVTCYSC